MKIQLSDDNIASVYFRYDTVPKGKKQVRRATAFVEFFLNSGMANPHHHPCVGVSVCSIHDNFSRIKGRKIALARALTKEEGYIRKGIWTGLEQQGMKLEHKKPEREIYLLQPDLPFMGSGETI